MLKNIEVSNGRETREHSGFSRGKIFFIFHLLFVCCIVKLIRRNVTLKYLRLVHSKSKHRIKPSVLITSLKQIHNVFNDIEEKLEEQIPIS